MILFVSLYFIRKIFIRLLVNTVPATYCVFFQQLADLISLSQQESYFVQIRFAWFQESITAGDGHHLRSPLFHFLYPLCRFLFFCF